MQLKFDTPGLMLTHHTVECAKARLNPESHWLVNGSF